MNDTPATVTEVKAPALADTKSFGTILACSISESDVDKEEVKKAFVTAGFDPQYIPTQRMPRRAFRKALAESVEGEDFLIRAITTDNNQLSCGLVKEDIDKTQKNLDYEVSNVFTLDSSSDTIIAKGDFRKDSVAQSYESLITQLGAQEINAKLDQLLFDSLAIMVLCEKAVFVPRYYEMNVGKIVKLFEELTKLGFTAQVEVMSVDNDSRTRDNIVRRFMGQTIEYFKKETANIIDQRKNYENGKIKFLRPTAFRKKLLKLATIERRIKMYIQLLNLSAEDGEVLIKALTTYDEELRKNIDLAEQSAATKKKSKKAAMEAIAEASAESPTV